MRRPGRREVDIRKCTNETPKESPCPTLLAIPADRDALSLDRRGSKRLDDPVSNLVRYFDEREAGFSTFSRLLEAMEKAGLCTRLQQGRQWYVTSKEGAPEAKGSGTAKTPESVEAMPEARNFDEEDEIPDPPDHGD